MTAAILQIAQWSAENQPYSLALWVVLAGLLYWAWARLASAVAIGRASCRPER